VRLIAALGAVAAALALAACGGGGSTRGAGLWPGSAATHPGRGPGHLTVALDPRVLPLNLLVAEADDRIVSISPRGQVVWRIHQDDPTQVFVSRTGRTLLIAERHRALVVLRRIDSRQVSFRYGHANVHGDRPGLLDAPETALETPSGQIVIADPGNCTVTTVSPSSHRPVSTLGTPGVCSHHPPATFATPDAALPAAGGGLVVTERDPAWIDVLSFTDRVTRAVALHGFSAASDASAYGPNLLIVAEATSPGKVEELERGKVIWSYGPSAGPGRLDDPAQASVLPDGDVLIVDSDNDRVIVVDRVSSAIVWQYGHTAVAGRGPGYLDDPGSATLVPLGS
jgi:hypothetical protein